MKLYNLFTLALSFFIFFSCDESTITEDSGIDPSLELVSPGGHELAKNFSELKDVIVSTDVEINKEEINLLSIEHFDEEDFTASVINYTANGEHSSMLATNNLGSNYIVLSDRTTVEFVKVGDEGITLVDDTKTVLIEEKDLDISVSFNHYTCGGKSCCGFTRIGPNRFRCACGPATFINEDEPDFEVGAGCVVKDQG